MIKSSDDVVHLWDFADGREPAPEVGQGPAFREIAVWATTASRSATFAASPDGRILAGGSSGFSESGPDDPALGSGNGETAR